MGALPKVERHYLNYVSDSARWDHYVPRKGDVIVCTSYKAGTTWTQMICASILHKRPDLPAPLAELSPWLDMRVAAIGDVIASLDRQTHRRVIKTHTALDGLRYHEKVTYIFCGRDPRDVFMSLQAHMANANLEKFNKLLEAQGVTIEPASPLPESLDERFRMWATMGTFDWEEDGMPYWSHMRHAETYWTHRTLPNLHFVHYSDLKRDLEGEMRRIAGILGVEIAEEVWPRLVKAAGFAEMKSNADRVAPDTQHGIWRSTSQFFNKGTSGQWRGALSEESLRLYDKVARPRYDNVMMDWLENGRTAADPKAV